MQIQIYGKKLTPCYGPGTQGGSGVWGLHTPAHPRDIRVAAVTILGLGGLGNVESPGYLRVDVAPRNGATPGKSFFDETLDGATDEFVGAVLAGDFTVNVGVFDLPQEFSDELMVTVYASGGNAKGPDPNVGYADIRVICDFGFAPAPIPGAAVKP